MAGNDFDPVDLWDVGELLGIVMWDGLGWPVLRTVNHRSRRFVYNFDF